MEEQNLWRILSRCPELERSIPDVLEALASTIPVEAVIVLAIELEPMRPRRVAEAWASRGGPSAYVPPVRAWDGAQAERIRTWHRGGAVRRGTVSSEPILDLLWPEGANRDVVAVPLRDEGQGAAIALLVVAGGFSAQDEARCAGLLEPLGPAFATDRRLHELSRLRETLEADKRALLSRLDRQDIVEEVVGGDAGLAPVMEKVGQVAPTDAPVLILGETGAGKEVLARAIHGRSRRARGPMLRINCGAIPPGLVDSELFGHERGSFTGAVASRPGWFERADGGTLFLDEVAELPLDAQVRLLRVLQDGVLERVGGTRAIHVDVRIVAATHRDLEEMARQGTFRPDLWYRLSVFPVYLPPLRERPRDIPELAAHFAARAGKRLGGAALFPSPDDVALLVAYDWPGNVRELAAVIERAAILGNGKSLHVAKALGTRSSRASLPPPAAAPGAVDFATTSTPSSRAPDAGAPGLDGASPALSTLDDAIRAHIERALALTHGRVEGRGGAAERLAINPHTLRSRMRRLGLRWAQFRRPET